jgi:hypothetical protein
MSLLKRLRKRIEANGRQLFELSVLPKKQANHYAKYRDRPADFAREVLGVTFTDKQNEIAEGLLAPPYRVLASSANSQGKTNAAAAIVLWWYATRQPAKVITTAPKFEQLQNILWAEIRRLARRMEYPLPFSPKACRIERDPEDFAIGVVARDDTKFHGKHGPNQLFLFEEGTGIEAPIFTATSSMFAPPDHAWLVIFNPTTTNSRVYVEYSQVQSATRRGDPMPWKIVHMSALDHPNIAAELKGLPPVIPDAMRVGQFETMLREGSTLSGTDPRKPIGSDGGPLPGDVVWPPLWAKDYCERTGQVSRVYQPGPEVQARLLARFPDQSATAVWGDGDWKSACRELDGQEPLEEPCGDGMPIPELGCDVARFGDDMTEIHARCGSVSILHEVHAKNRTDQTSGRLMVLAKWLADWYNRRKEHLTPAITWEQIPIKIDDDGVGGGVSDNLMGKSAAVFRIVAQTDPNDAGRYPNKRSELWFVTAERARRGDLDLSRLSPTIQDQLKRQALTPTWSQDSEGRRVVEKKEDMKKRLKRSSDGIDACNLAYYQVGVRGISGSIAVPRNNPRGR